MRHQANELAHREGLSLNQFISLAVAEKVGRMEQQACMREQLKSSHEESGRLRLLAHRQG